MGKEGNNKNETNLFYTEYAKCERDESKELKQIENAKVKSRIFTNLAHDLKTPIAVIESAVQMMEKDFELDQNERESSMRRHLSFVKYNTSALIRMIKNITMICSMESGNYILEKQNCNIISVIENKVMSMIPYAQHRNISIIFDTEIEEQYMECDIDKIEAIIQNLISNAIKYGMSNGYIKVDIRCKDESIHIMVEDNGKGISEHNQNNIFDRYSRGEGIDMGCCEGSGIGLYVVKTIVEMHKGDIKLKSDIGKGSIFEIKLPII